MTSPRRAAPYDRTQVLLRGLRNSGLCVLYHDAALAVRLVENAPAYWPPPADILARGDAAIFDAATAERVLEIKQGVLQTGTAARMEVALRGDDRETRWFELRIEADADDPAAEEVTGAVRGLFVSVIDITELKTREEAQRALLYEVSHRSRNLLAILQSVLGHTARSSDSIATFERKFRGRIAALAHSQDLITRSNWQGVRFHRLVLNQLGDYLGPGVTPPVILGPDPLIGPNAALHLGLALHELAANSASFGVLAQECGDIAIETETTVQGQSMTWTEDLTRPRSTPEGSGFGRSILTLIVPRAVNGHAEYHLSADQVRYRIDWPEAIPV